MSTARYRYEFGGFTLDHRNWTLLGPDGTRVGLTPKAFDALVCFLEHAGEVIDRATLIDALWPETVVEENNLRQVVAALRRTLGDELIETVPRRGYRFAADVRIVPYGADGADGAEGTQGTEGADGAASTTSPHTGETRPRRFPRRTAALVAASLTVLAAIGLWYMASPLFDNEAREPIGLAVLPFLDTSPDRDLEHVADAIAIELLTTLSLIDGLVVPGTTSSFYFKDHPADLATIQDLLAVDYVLEGDIRSADDRLRIAVRLTDADTGLQVWSESYDRVIDDLFALQDEIARTTAQALEITLGVGDLGTRLGATRNAEAFFAVVEASRVLRQGNRFSPADVRAAIPHLERAVAIDESCALCWFELYWQSRWLDILATETGGSAPGARERAEHALRRVEALTPNLPDLVTARIETSADGHDIALVFEKLLAESASVDYPPSVLSLIEARYLRFTGRVQESASAAALARAFDPLNPIVVGLLAEGYSAEGRHRDALDLIDEFVAINGPTPGLEGTTFVVALQLDDPEEVVERAAALRDSSSSIVGDLVDSIDDAERSLSLLRDFVASPDPTMVLWPTFLAPWAAYFGDDELALEMYRHEVPFATGNTISRPIFAGMRRLPGFKDLVRNVGLVSYWRESGNWPDYCRPLDREGLECF